MIASARANAPFTQRQFWSRTTDVASDTHVPLAAQLVIGKGGWTSGTWEPICCAETSEAIPASASIILNAVYLSGRAICRNHTTFYLDLVKSLSAGAR